MSIRPLTYLSFLLKSTNAHGVHSPFVFDYVTQCLNGQKRYSKDRCINVLLKSIKYFNARNVHIESKEEAEKKILEAFKQVNFGNQLSDIMLFDELGTTKFRNLLNRGKLHNDSMILVDSIHETTNKEADWQELIALPEITVSIDMYYCGAIFLRKEQVKQHFTIRI